MMAATIIVCAWFGSWHWLTVAMLLPILYLVDTAALWVCYLAVMRLQMVRDTDKLHAEAVIFAEAVLYAGLLLDLSYNWTWATLAFLDMPREPLVTGRLERYKYGRAYRLQRTGPWRWSIVRADVAPATGWRLARAVWFGDVLLDPFDPNPAGHVRP